MGMSCSPASGDLGGTIVLVTLGSVAHRHSSKGITKLDWGYVNTNMGKRKGPGIKSDGFEDFRGWIIVYARVRDVFVCGMGKGREKGSAERSLRSRDTQADVEDWNAHVREGLT